MTAQALVTISDTGLEVSRYIRVEAMCAPLGTTLNDVVLERLTRLLRQRVPNASLHSPDGFVLHIHIDELDDPPWADIYWMLTRGLAPQTLRCHLPDGETIVFEPHLGGTGSKSRGLRHFPGLESTAHY